LPAICLTVRQWVLPAALLHVAYTSAAPTGVAATLSVVPAILAARHNGLRIKVASDVGHSAAARRTLLLLRRLSRIPVKKVSGQQTATDTELFRRPHHLARSRRGSSRAARRAQ